MANVRERMRLFGEIGTIADSKENRKMDEITNKKMLGAIKIESAVSR